MAGDFDGAAADGGPLGRLSIFLLVLALQLVDGYFDHLKKAGVKSKGEKQLRNEIRELLLEAKSLSTPSTFAQAAKLRRMAAAKEKELLRLQEESKKVSKNFYNHYTRLVKASKVVLFAYLSWRFWGLPVAAVPPHLLQPFGGFLSWTSGVSASGKIMVGVVPWLVLTSRVSKFLCQKFLTIILK